MSMQTVIQERNALMSAANEDRRERDRLKKTIEDMKETIEEYIGAIQQLQKHHSNAVNETYNREVACQDYRKQIYELQFELEKATAMISKERSYNANAPQILIENIQRRERAIQHHKNVAFMSEHNAAYLEKELTAARADITDLQQENADMRKSMEMGSMSSVGKKKAWRSPVLKWRG